MNIEYWVCANAYLCLITRYSMISSLRLITVPTFALPIQKFRGIPVADYLIDSSVRFQDLHMVNMEEFRYGGTNVTAFRLLDPEREEVKQVVQDWIYGEMRFNRLSDSATPGFKVRHLAWKTLNLFHSFCHVC